MSLPVDILLSETIKILFDYLRTELAKQGKTESEIDLLIENLWVEASKRPAKDLPDV